MRASAGSALSVETTLADWHAAQSAVANFNFEAHADEVPRVDARSLNDRDVLAQQLATAPLGAVLVENVFQLPRELMIAQLGRGQLRRPRPPKERHEQGLLLLRHLAPLLRLDVDDLIRLSLLLLDERGRPWPFPLQAPRVGLCPADSLPSGHAKVAGVSLYPSSSPAGRRPEAQWPRARAEQR